MAEVRAVEVGVQALQLLVLPAKALLLLCGKSVDTAAADALHVRKGVQEGVMAEAPACNQINLPNLLSKLCCTEMVCNMDFSLHFDSFSYDA